MNESEAMGVLESVLSAADADHVVAVIGGGQHSATRFSDNVITQNTRQSPLMTHI